MADVPVYLPMGYGICWGTKSPTHTPTPAKPVNIPWGFCYPCQSLHPTATSLQQHPCCLPQQPHGRQWQQDGRVEGEWVEGERETGKVTTTQCATHVLCHRFLFLYVVWWHGVQPTHCIIYFIPSMLFDDAVCNLHTASSISFSPCFLMMWHATHMPCQLFLSLHVVWWHDMHQECTNLALAVFGSLWLSLLMIGCTFGV